MMVKGLIFTLVLGTLIVVSQCDVYLHGPRGSNNRLNERSANRRNANRAFDSQNNNRGGYNVGDKTDKPFQNEDGQYNMKYFQSGEKNGKSKLVIEWTNQHGCGGNEDTDPHKLNCNMVLQYMCEDEGTKDYDQLRNGRITNTNAFSRRAPQSIERESKSSVEGRMAGEAAKDKVVQEPWKWYDKCRNRIRNKGLFTADQRLRGEEAIYTRQNPNGNRRGYECPEERDYYPYWHPTPFKDIAVLAPNASLCKYFKENSFNTKEKYECMQKYPNDPVNYRFNSRHNNERDCKANGGEWLPFMNYLERAPRFKTKQTCLGANSAASKVKYGWGRRLYNYQEECLVLLPEIDCQEGMWSRVNHLGNGRDGVPLNYTWTLPYFPSGKMKKCIFRIRYNISTDDYDPYNTDSSSNKDLNKGTVSPIEQNPEVDIGLRNIPLRLAINTAQFGRTFQDRSHVFHLMPRKDTFGDKNIYNINVRGKRGNIVQVYPAVEYDFLPTRLTIKEDDLVHFQWTGSNTHNNGNPAGDGQAGDDGEGTRGTDRNNVMEMQSADQNYPLPIEKGEMFEGAKVLWYGDVLEDIEKAKNTNYKSTIQKDMYSSEDIAISLASAGYFACKRKSVCGRRSLEERNAVNNQLNNAYASYAGMVIKLKKGRYHYVCTRNNNFTNRSQKGQLIVEQ